MADPVTFVKAKISDLVNGQFNENDNQGFVKTPEGKELAAVRIMATVVEKFNAKDGNYIALTLDDCTETIRAKFFQQGLSLAKDIEVGDTVDIFGFARQYEGETYIAPMLLRKITDLNEEILRRLEFFSPASAVKAPLDLESAVLAKIAELDKGDGVKIEMLAESMNIEADAAVETIRNLLIKGDLYEPKKGIVKKVD